MDLNVQPYYHKVILLTFAIITLFTFGCALHMIFVGDRSARELRRDIQKQIALLTSFVVSETRRLQKLEGELLPHTALIRPRTFDSLNQARRILAAIARRINEINRLLATKNEYDLMDAHEILNRRLVVTENALESLIGAEPLPPLEREAWIGTIEAMCHAIEADLLHVRLAA